MGKDNFTDKWMNCSPQSVYDLPAVCPICKADLKPRECQVGVFPYLHADVGLQCWLHPEHRFWFCFPYNTNVVDGYTIFDSSEQKRYVTDKCCPFHPTQKLSPIRLYGDLVFKDGTKKIQLRCPICNYSERRLFTK